MVARRVGYAKRVAKWGRRQVVPGRGERGPLTHILPLAWGWRDGPGGLGVNEITHRHSFLDYRKVGYLYLHLGVRPRHDNVIHPTDSASASPSQPPPDKEIQDLPGLHHVPSSQAQM